MDWSDDPERGHRRGVLNPTRMAHALTFFAVLIGVGTFVAFCGSVEGASETGDLEDREIDWGAAIWVLLRGLVPTLVLGALAALLHWCAALYQHVARREP